MKGRATIVAAIAWATFATWTVAPASAECISMVAPGTSSPLEAAFKIATAAFVGDVTRVEADGERVRFKVLESFKGVRLGEQTLNLDREVHRFVFRVGQRVLVFAQRLEGSPRVLSTSCSLTGEIDLADPVIRSLRALRERAR